MRLLARHSLTGKLDNGRGVPRSQFFALSISSLLRTHRAESC
jgi:hypothetical protein